MPDIEAQMPDGTIATFPEGTSQSVIDMVAKKNAAALKLPQEESLGDFAKGFGGNVIKSGFETLKSGVDAVEHLPTTIGNLKDVGLGVAEKAFGLAPVHAKQADAVGQFYKDRYGGWENIKKTAYEDPVGMLLDALPAVGAVGKGLKIAGTAGNLGTIADIGRSLETAGTLGAGKVVGAAAEPLKEAGVNTMVRALKPTNAVLEGAGKRWGPISDLSGRARGIARALIEERVNPNEAGVRTLMERLASNEKEGDILTQHSTAMVDTSPTTRNLQAGKSEATWQALGEGAEGTWKNAAEEWNRNPHVSSPVTRNVPTYNPITGTFTPQPKVVGRALDPLIPFQSARKVTKGTYSAIGDAKFGEMSTPSIEAQKSIASGLREGMEAAEPDIASINARTGSLIDMRDVLSGASKRIGNMNPTDLLTMIAASGGHPGTTAIAIANRPAMAARIARGLHATGRGVGALAGIADPSLRAALLARLAEEDTQQHPPNQTPPVGAVPTPTPMPTPVITPPTPSTPPRVTAKKGGVKPRIPNAFSSAPGLAQILSQLLPLLPASPDEE